MAESRGKMDHFGTEPRLQRPPEVQPSTPPEVEGLLPCPFCGGPAELWRAHENRPAWVGCMGRCAVLVTREHKTDAEAVATWNRRSHLSRRAEPDGENTAWLVVEPGSELKRCPDCGDTALEGQAECYKCGMEPGDDDSWRVAGRLPSDPHFIGQPQEQVAPPETESGG